MLADAVRHQRSPVGVSWCATPRRGSRSSRASAPRTHGRRARRGGGSARRRAPARSRRQEGEDDREELGCASCAASRPRRSCASACTTSPVRLEPGAGLRSAGGRRGGVHRREHRPGAAGAGRALRTTRGRADGAGARQPGRARDALRLRRRPGVLVRRAKARASTGVAHQEWFARASQRVIGIARGDARGGAPLSRRHRPAPVGRAGHAGDVVQARSSAITRRRRPAGSASRCCARAWSTRPSR